MTEILFARKTDVDALLAGALRYDIAQTLSGAQLTQLRSNMGAGTVSKVDDTNVTLGLSGITTSNVLQSFTITAGWTGTLAAARLNANVVQGVVNDTNINGSISAQVLTFAWAGTLAAGRLNSNVVQAITNDTNVTGSISAQNLTLGWTGTLAAGRLNSNVVQAITNDTNVTGSITAQNLTLAWSGTLAVGRGGTGGGAASGTLLDNITGFSSTGHLVRTGAGAYSFRTMTGTANRLAITNGSGVAGNPTFDIDSAYVGQSSITTLGTITTGVWSGTAIVETKGGTNQTTYTLGDILYASGGNTLSKLAGNITTTRNFLRQTGGGAISAAPAWDTILAADVPGSALTRTNDTNVTVTLGGTPSTALLAATSLTLGWSGTLSIARGGTGAGTQQAALNALMPTPTRAGDMVYYDGGNWVALAGNNVGTKVLQQTSSGVPSWATVAGTGDLISTNNLSDVTAKYTSYDNLSVHGGDVASAGTTNLETATGNLVDVTGTTTITAITLNEGHERTVRFTGILTLTNGASLVLPGGANITTAAGDYGIFRGYAAGVVRCVAYQKASGTSVISSFSAAAQSDMETATSTTLGTTPGRQHFHPAHLKAMYSATITPTAVAGAATSWDTTAESCLWNTTHGLSSGEVIYIATAAPAGTTINTCYYAGVVDTTHFTLHLTQADAIAGTNKVNITGTALTTIRKWIATNVLSYGMTSTGAVGPAPAANVNMGMAFTLSPGFSSAVALPLMSVAGLIGKNAAALTTLVTSIVPMPSTTAATVISYANANIWVLDQNAGGALNNPGSWLTQGTTAFTIYFEAYGDLA